MWQRTWAYRTDRIPPLDENVVATIEEEGYPDWFMDGVNEDRKLAAQMSYLHVGPVASESLNMQTTVEWSGLIDSYGERQGMVHQTTVDLKLYWIYDGLYIGFRNGPEPVLLWQWK